MNFELIIREEANLEIIDAYLYYELQSAGLGDQFFVHLDIYLERIQKFPEHYQIKKKPYRQAFINKFPYIIIYEILDGKIIVYSVFNT